ncbi:MAG: NERD domain-containing protein [Synechococcales cyanobacterium M58_A2018_015]|nr:NERD domain-containing protein [Synechococcales cyanobacterium M58_A2018_015]
MPKSSRSSSRSARPGQNIRNLALQRRLRAIQCFIAAATVVASPPLLLKALAEVINQPVQVPASLTLSLVVIALGLVAGGVYQWKRANHADQGAQGEEKVASELSCLQDSGWTIEHGIKVPRWGDVDHVCRSPQGRIYAIDTKSHKGIVFRNPNGTLERKIGGKIMAFEKDFLTAVKGQATQIKQQKRVTFVTPILVFSEAKVNVGSDPRVQGVYVVERAELVRWLQKLG